MIKLYNCEGSLFVWSDFKDMHDRDGEFQSRAP